MFLVKEMKKGLIVGRFQPLCKNHLALFDFVLKQVDELYIGIGTSNMQRAQEVLSGKALELYRYNYVFDFQRVKSWIENTLTDKNVHIVPVQDIFDNENYEEHLIASFAKEGFDVKDCTLFGENEKTEVCFHMPIVNTKNVADFHATQVRQELVQKGFSEGLAVKLTKEELDTVLKAEKMKEWIQKGAKVKFEGHVNLVLIPYLGKDYQVVVSPDACVLMYIDEEDNVWFTKQFRPPAQRIVLELPAETIDKPGKSPAEHAREGLEEECGLQIKKSQMQFVTSVYSSEGHDTELVHLFKAKGPHKVVGQRLEDDERIEVVKIPFTTAYEMMQKGEIQGSKTTILLQEEYIARLEAKGKTPITKKLPKDKGGMI